MILELVGEPAGSVVPDTDVGLDPPGIDVLRELTPVVVADERG